MLVRRKHEVRIYFVRPEVVTAKVTRITTFWGVIECSLVERCKQFKGVSNLCPVGRRVYLEWIDPNRDK
jgi:hypothetical protein